MFTRIAALVTREVACNVKLVLLNENDAIIPLRCEVTPRMNEVIVVGKSSYRVHAVVHVRETTYLAVDIAKG